MITSKLISRTMGFLAKELASEAVSQLAIQAILWLTSSHIGIAVILTAGPFAILCFTLYALYKCN